MVVILTLNTLHYAIPKIINYCEFYNTQGRLYILILCLLLSCSSWSVCTISKFCCRLIYNALLSREFSRCDSQHFNTTFNSISTQHCTSPIDWSIFQRQGIPKTSSQIVQLIRVVWGPLAPRRRIQAQRAEFQNVRTITGYTFINICKGENAINV